MAQYWVVTTGPKDQPGINGGFMNSPDDQVRTVNTVDVEDMDDACARVTAAGGKIVVPKVAIAGMAWIAYGTDPTGGLFGLHQDDPTAK